MSYIPLITLPPMPTIVSATSTSHPPSSQTSENIFPTENDLFSAKSNKRLKHTRKETPPIHRSCQNKVHSPSPTFLNTNSSNEPPSLPLTPSQIFATSLHREEQLRSPTSHPLHHTKVLLYPLTFFNTIYLTKRY